MKVEIKLQPDLKSPYAVIYTGELTTEVHRAAAVLAEERADLVPAEENDKIVMLHPEEIYLVRVENEKTIIYTAKKQYQSNRRLYELNARQKFYADFKERNHEFTTVGLCCAGTWRRYGLSAEKWPAGLCFQKISPGFQTISGALSEEEVSA